MISEYQGLVASIKEGEWLSRTVAQSTNQPRRPVLIYEDNDSCLQVINNPQINAKNKHEDIKLKYSRERLKEGHIIIKGIASKDNTADFFTKPHPRKTCEKFCETVKLKPSEISPD